MASQLTLLENIAFKTNTVKKFAFLTLGGTHQILGNYLMLSEFSYTNILSSPIYIEKLIILISDNILDQYSAYGDSVTLLNGIRLYYTDINGAQINLTPENIKTNGEWGSVCSSYTQVGPLGTGSEILQILFNFAPTPLVIHPNERIAFEVLDDYSDMEGHTCCIEYYENNTI